MTLPLLCASLFYFRLPREEWRDRLAQVRASGYTCVDVYFPWNFHETAPGEWDFTGRRDLAAFLDLAHAEGLSVIARPGPYICSEWDGGALPAWLGLDPQLRVRQHEPRFLAQVGRWFDMVLPLLAERQHPAGPVIMVQLENELDFFDCTDRAGYLTALRDLATGHGLTVPLIACAGQGDLTGATGDVPGIVPACNFYPDDGSPDIEAEVRHYADLLAGRGLPLMVTETNRSHRTLRRLLAAGATLLGPYLQSSGWNFGFTPSSGNWGTPGNLMTHSYDFGGYVSSTGAERPGYTEGRVLARILDALRPQLAEAAPGEAGVEIDTDFPTSTAPAALDLAGGGLLLALPNLGADAGTAILSGAALGRVPVAVPGDACPLMLLGLPLPALTLTLASADLVGLAPAGNAVAGTAMGEAAVAGVAAAAVNGATASVGAAGGDIAGGDIAGGDTEGGDTEGNGSAAGGGGLALAFSADVPVTVVLDGLWAARGGPGVAVSGDRVTAVIPAGETPVRRVVAGTDRNGAAVTVTLVVLPPAEAARLTRLHPDGRPEFAADAPSPTDAQHRTTTPLLSDAAPRPGASEIELHTGRRRRGLAPHRAAGAGHEQPPTLEALGVYRGRGTYTATADLTAVDDLLVVGAADLVDLSVAGRARPTIAGFGRTERIDVRDARGLTELRCTVEIWGHANFDDARLPALRLGALRGPGSIWAVTAARDVSAHWRVSSPAQWAGEPAPIGSPGGRSGPAQRAGESASIGSSGGWSGPAQWAGEPAPIRSLGGWSSTRVGRPITYTRALAATPDTVAALHLAGLATPVTVAADGGEPVTVHPENPWLLLPAGTTQVALTTLHQPSSAPVRPELLTLRPVTGWTCTAQDDAALLAYAMESAPEGERIDLPVSLAPGGEAWLDLDVPPGPEGWLVRLAGAQLRVTGWAAGECLGRLWLPDPQRPAFSGGDPDILWIPAAWAAAGTRLTLLLRGTAGPADPTLTAVCLTPARQPPPP